MKTEYQSRPPPEPVVKPAVRRLPEKKVQSSACVLVVVEGENDIKFLRHISMILHEHDPQVPDLAAREADGQIVFLPIGGGTIAAWSERLAPTGCPEFHLFDRELPPESELRQEAIRHTISRPGCHGVLTRMRSLENYLHPEAIRAAGGPPVAFGEDDCVPELVAKSVFEIGHPHVSWDTLSRRAHKRLANRAKRWLNTRAVDCMTPKLLRESDPWGDILSWLATIDSLAG